LINSTSISINFVGEKQPSINEHTILYNKPIITTNQHTFDLLILWLLAETQPVEINATSTDEDIKVKRAHIHVI
jgi:hypothetical protein